MRKKQSDERYRPHTLSTVLSGKRGRKRERMCSRKQPAVSTQRGFLICVNVTVYCRWNRQGWGCVYCLLSTVLMSWWFDAQRWRSVKPTSLSLLDASALIKQQHLRTLCIVVWIEYRFRFQIRNPKTSRKCDKTFFSSLKEKKMALVLETHMTLAHIIELSFSQRTSLLQPYVVSLLARAATSLHHNPNALSCFVLLFTKVPTLGSCILSITRKRTRNKWLLWAALTLFHCIPASKFAILP